MSRDYKKFQGTRKSNRDKEIADEAMKDVREDSKNSRTSGNSKHRKGKKPRSQDKRGGSNYNRKDVMSTSNPFSWYNAFPQVIKDAGNLAFGIPLGSPISASPKTAGYPETKEYMPGLMAIRFIPGIGWSADKNSPVNRAATRMFVYLRSAQKAAKDYNSQDMMMMILALDSLYMYHELLKRAYGLMSFVTPVNKYFPRVIVESMGFDFDDLEANLSDFRAYINQFAINLGSYTLPGNIDILARHKWMCSGLYADQDSAKAQVYYFVPEGFWKYNNTVASGSELNLVQWYKEPGDNVTNLKTLKDIKNFGSDLLNAILGDEDAAFISGDLLAAFGEKVMATLEETPEGYRIYPSYDPVVLSQIQNATLTTMYPWKDNSASLRKITQDPSINQGAIIYKPTVYTGAPFLAENRMLNVYNMNVGYEQVVEMTRLVCQCTNNVTPTAGTGEQLWELNAASADICTVASIYTIDPSVTTSAYQAVHGARYFNIISGDIRGTTVNLCMEQMGRIAKLSAFDWAPQHAIYNTKGSAWGGPVRIWEVDNVTTISPEQLVALQEAAFTSLFNVPEMAFTNKA